MFIPNRKSAYYSNIVEIFTDRSYPIRQNWQKCLQGKNMEKWVTTLEDFHI